MAVAVTAAALALAGCSTSLEAQRQPDGQCIQERTKKFLGITYSQNDYRVHCASQ